MSRTILEGAAHALHRIAGVSRRRRERRLRNGGAYGGHEGRLRQRRQAHRRIAIDLQQGPPGRDHERAFGDRGRRGCCLKERSSMTTMAEGKITQIIGAVIDVQFPRDQSPRSTRR